MVQLLMTFKKKIKILKIQISFGTLIVKSRNMSLTGRGISLTRLGKR